MSNLQFQMGIGDIQFGLWTGCSPRIISNAFQSFFEEYFLGTPLERIRIVSNDGRLSSIDVNMCSSEEKTLFVFFPTIERVGSYIKKDGFFYQDVTSLQSFSRIGDYVFFNDDNILFITLAPLFGYIQREGWGQKLSEILSSVSDTLKNSFKDLREKLVKKNIKKIATQIFNNEANRIYKEKSDISRLNSEISDYRRRIISNNFLLSEKNIFLDALTAKHNMDYIIQTLEEEYESIYRDKRLLDMSFPDLSHIQYETDTIICSLGTENGKKYLMGKYRITVNIEDSSVRFFNLTEENRRRSYWGDHCHHPHVSHEGIPCLGNAADVIMDLVSSKSFGTLGSFLANYLSSVNMSDPAGAKIINWDECDDEGNVTVPAGKCVCPECGKLVDADSLIHCPICDRKVCPDCAEEDVKTISLIGDVKTSVSSRFCLKCVSERENFYCESCGDYVSDQNDFTTLPTSAELMRSCDSCGKQLCIRCYNNSLQCQSCGKKICLSCVESVSVAGQNFNMCKSCADDISPDRHSFN